jgi:hypothetical protein
MDILEDISAEHRYKTSIKWFKRLCFGLILILICAGCFIYYTNSLGQKHLAHDIKVGDEFIRNCLGLEEYTNQDQLKYKRPGNDILEISKIQALIRKSKTAQALERLDSIILNTKSLSLASLARIIWMSVSIDLKDIDKEKFELYTRYFAKDDKLFWARAKVLTAIFFLKNNETEKSKEILEELLYSQYCSANIKEEAKSIMTLIKR